MKDSKSTYLLQKLNDEKAIVLIPAIIFISLLMLTGLIGNIVVCYFYGCQAKTKPTSCFIIGMSILDLLSCIISMPMEIVDMRFFYMFPNVTLCKVSRTTSFFCTIASGLILISIAMERYRRICLPFRKQFTVFQAKVMCLISVLTACVLSWPCLVLYTIIDVDIPIPGSRIIQGYDCTTVRNDSFKIYVDVFNFTQVLMFFFTVIPLIILYVSVFNKLKQFHTYRLGQLCLSPKPSVFQKGDNSKDTDTPICCHNNANVRVLKKLKKPNDGRNLAKSTLIHNESKWKDMTNEILFVREEHTKLSQSESANNDESLRSIELERNNSVTEKEKQCPSIEPIQTVEDAEYGGTCVTFSTGEIANIRLGSGYYFQKKKSTDLNKLRNTTLMLVIAIPFIASFVPYLCLMVWRNLSTGYVVNQMTDIQLVVFSIGIRSYFLNSTMNPIIYGVFNSQFRGIFASVLCAWGEPNLAVSQRLRQQTLSNPKFEHMRDEGNKRHSWNIVYYS